MARKELPIDFKNEKGETALHIATQKNFEELPETTHYLFEKNRRMRIGNLITIQSLIRNGPNPSLKSAATKQKSPRARFQNYFFYIHPNTTALEMILASKKEQTKIKNDIASLLITYSANPVSNEEHSRCQTIM
ncbi:MAG: hypothetical protein H0U70_00965 [Tatlockia sp.]|nr:hypothetical protein [Tatlockia sp.]